MKGKFTRGEALRMGGAALITASALGVAGCGGSEDSGGQLRMSWWGSTERNERTNGALKLFEKRNPNIKISTEFTGDFAQYWNRLATQASGGNAPDVMQTDYRYLTEYAGRGVLLDLGEYTPDPISLENFDHSLIDGGRIDGKIYGITLGNNTQTVIYDVSMFEAAGIEALNNDWSWEDLAGISKEISAAGGEGVFGTADGSGSEPLFEVFLRQRGLSLYDGDRIGFEKAELAEWWGYWRDLRDSGAAASAEVMAAGAEAMESTPILAGKAATTFQWSNQYTAFSALTDKNLDLVPVPGGAEPSGQYIKPSQLLSAYSRTDYSEESAALMDFLLNDPEANKILGTERGISGNSKIRKMLKAEVPASEQRIFDYVDYVSGIASSLPPPPPQGAGEIDALLIRTAEDVAFGRSSIKESVDEYFSEANRILSA